MKNYKYIGLFLLSLGLVSCDVNNELDEIEAEIRRGGSIKYQWT